MKSSDSKAAAFQQQRPAVLPNLKFMSMPRPGACPAIFSGLIFMLSFFSLLFFTGRDACLAGPPAAAQGQRIDIKNLTVLDQQKKIKQQEQAASPVDKTRMERLQKGIETQKNKVLQTQKKEKSLLGEMEKIDHKLLAQKTELSSLNKKYDDQETLLEFKHRDLERVTADKEALKEHVKKRLSAYYQMGSVGILNVIFSSRTLPELLTFQDYFHKLLQYDQETLDSYLGKIKELYLASEAHAREKERLISLVDKVEKEKDLLAATYDDKSKLLSRVNTEKSLYLQAVSEIEEAAANLARTFEKLKEKSATPRETAAKESPAAVAPAPVVAAKTAGGKKITALKGRLEPPVYGTVVTNFGVSEEGRFGINTFANGIDIKADEGTEIKAIFDGKVIHSGYLRGYGNLIIIDHGEQYYSLVSRIGKLNKNEGAMVSRGEVIGVMGENAALLGEGLHFEIRHGSSPENPLQWLNNAGLKIKATRNSAK